MATLNGQYVRKRFDPQGYLVIDGRRWASIVGFADHPVDALIVNGIVIKIWVYEKTGFSI